METGAGFGNQRATVNLAEAEVLGGELIEHAAAQASLDYEFCRLLGEFDTAGGPGQYYGIKSTAHWVAHYCAMSTGTAREHVRVARLLPQMPRTSELFRQGRFSYSKVREITRLAGLVDEDELCELALMMTASQLARTVRAYRSCAGTRIQAISKRQLTTTETSDGMVRITVVLGAEEAALVSAAIEAAARQQQPAQTQAEDVPAGTPRKPEPTDRVQALVDVAACYLDSDTRDPVDDHTLVIVHVNAEQLTTGSDQTAENVPAGTPDGRDTSEHPGSVDHVGPDVTVEKVPAGTSPSQANPTLIPSGGPASAGSESVANQTAGNVPAGTSGVLASTVPDRGARHQTHGIVLQQRTENVPAGTSSGLLSQVCFVEGHGPIEAATAQRLVCTSRIMGAIIDKHGQVLALGNTKRLASRSQRRALRVRDHGACQFPSCTQTRHLDAHHLVAWSTGGPTDLDNLILLCRRHHVMVHEGGIFIRHRDPQDGPVLPGHRFRFLLPEGTPITGTWRENHAPEAIERLLANHAARIAASPEAKRPDRITARYGGEGFLLHECVRVLFNIQLQETPTAA